jgi:hypothetical protein
MKIAVSYVFDVIEAADGPKSAGIPAGLPAELPIVMTSDFRFAFPTDYDAENADSFVSRLAAAIARWHALNQPAPGIALMFDLTVFANLSQAKLPLFRLHHLALPVEGVDQDWWNG